MARMVRTWPEAQAPEVAPDPGRDKSAALLADAERLMVATNELLVRKRR
jgi:hypothetical protein